MTGIGVVVWGCDISAISFSASFRYEFRFANPALTASAQDAATPLVRLADGTGTMFVDGYRIEWWEYIKDDDGVVVDSVARTLTASGHADLGLGADLLRDGVISDDDEGLPAAAARLRAAAPNATGPGPGARYVRGARARIRNDRPSIPDFGVNAEGSGDMYYKGGNMLHTIRQIVDDDRWPKHPERRGHR